MLHSHCHMDEDSKLDGDIASNSRSRVASFSCLNELSISSGNVLDESKVVSQE